MIKIFIYILRFLNLLFFTNQILNLINFNRFQCDFFHVQLNAIILYNSHCKIYIYEIFRKYAFFNVFLNSMIMYNSFCKMYICKIFRQYVFLNVFLN